MCSTVAIFIGIIYFPGIHPVRAVLNLRDFFQRRAALSCKLDSRTCPQENTGFSFQSTYLLPSVLPCSGACTLRKQRSKKGYVTKTLHHSYYPIVDANIRCYHHPDEIKHCLYTNDFECCSSFLLCKFKINLWFTFKVNY